MIALGALFRKLDLKKTFVLINDVFGVKTQTIKVFHSFHFLIFIFFSFFVQFALYVTLQPSPKNKINSRCPADIMYDSLCEASC